MSRRIVNCKHWTELDDELGCLFEFCKAKEVKVTCAGVLHLCAHPAYFNIPRHRISAQKRRDDIERGKAWLEPFLIKGGVNNG